MTKEQFITSAESAEIREARAAAFAAPADEIARLAVYKSLRHPEKLIFVFIPEKSRPPKNPLKEGYLLTVFLKSQTCYKTDALNVLLTDEAIDNFIIFDGKTRIFG